jgi:VCBS repeat-containing protein
VSFTFVGTYTKNEGDAAASGTVTVTHADGTTGTATLDVDGAYELVLNTGDGPVTVVEVLEGSEIPNVFTTTVTTGATIDTSRDLGRVGFTQSGAPVDLAAYAGDVGLTAGDNTFSLTEGGISLEVADPAAEAFSLTAAAPGSTLFLQSSGDGGSVLVQANGTDGTVNIEAGTAKVECGVPGAGVMMLTADILGFVVGNAPALPAAGVVTLQDVVDALVGFGLVTQA